MNIIAGMMMPEMNWAPKLAWNSSSFCSAKPSSTSRWRPNTLTSSCPVNASSICALSWPVCLPLGDELSPASAWRSAR